jgi:hypothetical protein
VSARDRLFKVYAEWRTWTEQEGDAIRTSDWTRVRSCQRAKMELQPQILRCTDDARTEITRAGAAWSGTEQDLRKVVATLIELETRNGEILADLRQRAREEQDQLDRTTRSLRQVRSYAPAAQSGWSSYS